MGIKMKKNWSELSADERIERMRDIIKSLGTTVQAQDSAIEKLRDQLLDHKHTQDGEAVSKLSRRHAYRGDSEKMPSPENPNDIFF